MKKVISIVMGIWCAVTSFFTPIWLTLTALNFTGKIYEYDYSMDEGTALIFGVFMLAVWILFALLPDIIFIERMYKVKKKYASISLAIAVLLGVSCIVLCKWDIIVFLVEAGLF